MTEQRFLVTADEEGCRLDIFLSAKITHFSRARIQKIIEKDGVHIGGVPRKAGTRIHEGDEVFVIYEEEKPFTLQAEPIPLEIIYSDSHIIVLSKPSGMVVHPGAGRLHGTLVQALLHHFPEMRKVGDEKRPGIVHRLDKDTSGVMAAALTGEAFRHLQCQFKERRVKKTYLGLVWGRMSPSQGTFDKPIGRHVRDGNRMSVKTRRPREAKTEYKVVKNYREYSLLELQPYTGRTHQIRVHLAASGHPLVGDTCYGRRKKPAGSPRLFLHAFRLGFYHPHSGDWTSFESALPKDLSSFLEKLS